MGLCEQTRVPVQIQIRPSWAAPVGVCYKSKFGSHLIAQVVSATKCRGHRMLAWALELCTCSSTPQTRFWPIHWRTFDKLGETQAAFDVLPQIRISICRCCKRWHWSRVIWIWSRSNNMSTNNVSVMNCILYIRPFIIKLSRIHVNFSEACVLRKVGGCFWSHPLSEIVGEFSCTHYSIVAHSRFPCKHHRCDIQTPGISYPSVGLYMIGV